MLGGELGADDLLRYTTPGSCVNTSYPKHLVIAYFNYSVFTLLSGLPGSELASGFLGDGLADLRLATR